MASLNKVILMGHLTADERRRLETLLNRGESFRSIAEALGKS